LPEHDVGMVESHLDLDALAGRLGQLAGEAAIDNLDIDALDVALEDLLEQRRPPLPLPAEHGGGGGTDGEDLDLLALLQGVGAVGQRRFAAGRLAALLSYRRRFGRRFLSLGRLSRRVLSRRALRQRTRA